jgi:hypothetical protein
VGIRILRLRHRTPPLPESCRWCGLSRQGHARQHIQGRGWHEYTPPTPAQIIARARARRNVSAAFQMGTARL